MSQKYSAHDTSNLSNMPIQTLRTAFSRIKTKRLSWRIVLQRVIKHINASRSKPHPANNPVWSWILDWFRDLYVVSFIDLSESQQGRILSKWIMITFADAFADDHKHSINIFAAIRNFGSDYNQLMKREKQKVNTLLCNHLRKYFWPGQNADRMIYLKFKKAVARYMNSVRFTAIFFETVPTMQRTKRQLSDAGDWVNCTKLDRGIAAFGKILKGMTIQSPEITDTTSESLP